MWLGVPRFWRNIAIVSAVAAPCLSLLALFDRLDLPAAIAVLLAAGGASVVTSRLDRDEFASCGRWIASLGGGAEKSASAELGDLAAAHVARPVIELHRRRRRAEPHWPPNMNVSNG
ncbi:MAG: hypothetical protein R3C97_04930 [Geminicoccaceae bacterium]